MSPKGTITFWIGRLKAGDRDLAVQRLWEAYREELLRIAQQRLGHLSRRFADEEDVLQNAFKSFFHDIDKGCYPKLDDRDDLRQILFMLIRDKAADLAKHERRAKRGGGKVLDEQTAAGVTHTLEWWIDGIVGREPDPGVMLEFAEKVEHLLVILGNEELRFVAESMINGSSLEEIAAATDRSVRTVQRKIRLIRVLWTKELSQ